MDQISADQLVELAIRGDGSSNMLLALAELGKRLREAQVFYENQLGVMRARLSELQDRGDQLQRELASLQLPASPAMTPEVEGEKTAYALTAYALLRSLVHALPLDYVQNSQAIKTAMLKAVEPVGHGSRDDGVTSVAEQALVTLIRQLPLPDLAAALPCVVKRHESQKITLIKHVRRGKMLGLKEAKDLVEGRLPEEKF